MEKKYKYEDQILPPSLFTNLEGQCYIVPTWQKVDPDTTLSDIEWIKPNFRKLINIPGKYNTRFDFIKNKFYCDCPGFYKVKDKSLGCKHIQASKTK